MIEGVIEYFSYGGLLVVLLLGSLGLPIPEDMETEVRIVHV